MEAFRWIVLILLAFGLAASTGFNATLPLLMQSALAHFHVAGVALGSKFGWLSSDAALACLAVATVLEFVGDKIPGVDHFLHACGVFVRPCAGMLAAASVVAHADPAMAAIAGIILGGPISLGIAGATGTARLASSATTLGCANPRLRQPGPLEFGRSEFALPCAGGFLRAAARPRVCHRHGIDLVEIG